jgi:hypothetical protein
MEKELELLPPLPRYPCDICHKAYKHLDNTRDGKKVCGKCQRSRVTNKFYTPKELRKENKMISKFNITDTEKSVLINNGKSINRINNDLRILKGMKDKSKYKKELTELENKNKLDLNKQLIEGLKNAK